VLCSAAVCLSACSALPLSADGVKRRHDSERLVALVQFGAYVQSLDDSELAQQYDEMLSQYEASPSSDTAIKLSLLLSRDRSRPDALPEALRLLRDASETRGKDADLGRIIYYLVNAQYLALNDSGSLSTMLTEEQARSARLDAELAEVRATLQVAEKNRAALERQLNALKTIEEDQPR
jgi:hypothetical protein